MSWPTEKLSDVCIIQPPKSEIKRTVCPDSLVSFVPMSNLGIGSQSITLSEDKKLSDVSSGYTYFSDKDVLLAKITPCFENGKLGIAKGLTNKVGFGSSEYIVFRPSTKVTSEYLYYFLSQKSFRNEGAKHMKGSVGHKRVSKEFIANFQIPIPAIDIQNKVVTLLDKAFADIEQARANTEQNLRNARELFDSYLQQVFSERGEGYEEKTLKEISLDFGRGKSKHRPRNDESLYGGQYPFIQTGDVRNSEHVIKSYSKTYNDKGLSQSKLWPKGTICITIAANIAETGILDFDACFPDSVIGIVVDPKLTSISYVEFLLQSFKVILKAKGKGSAQDNINLGTFEKMHFPFPSIEKQNEIVTSLNQLLEATINLETVYAKKINSLDELKQSLLQQAFTGQLTQG